MPRSRSRCSPNGEKGMAQATRGRTRATSACVRPRVRRDTSHIARLSDHGRRCWRCPCRGQTMMRAMTIPRFGGPDVFEERQVETPIPGAGQVLVRVIASGTNPVDAKIRANGTWAGIVPPAILGYDVAGVIEQVGAGVTDFDVGDEVYYTPTIRDNQMGSYAEYNVAPAAIVARKPKNLSFVDAAAVPLAGGTAYEAIVR